MLSIWRLFWPLCQLQQGPQDVPADPALLRRVVLLCLAVGVVVFSLRLPFTDALLQAGVSLALSLLLWSGLLHVTGRSARRLQTLIAIFGCATLLNLLLLPLVLLINTLGNNAGLLPLLLIGLLIWSVLINGHILRHCLEWPLAASLALATTMLVLRQGIFHFIFG